MHTPGTHQSWSPSRRSVVAGAALSVLLPSLVRAKSVQGQFEDVVAAFDQERQRRGVPSISVALVEEGRILLHARGFADAQRAIAASTATVYQAASISKTIGALTALSLAQQGKIELDADVSTVLRQWKLPLVPQGGRGPITLRRLFGMTAGCNVPGYAGYSVGDPLPGDIAILNGDAPSNASAVRIVEPPGTVQMYSGGGCQIAQVVLEDATGLSYSRLVEQQLFVPLSMEDSSFRQPPPDLTHLARAHDNAGRPLAGSWHLYPELTAAGLWSTPANLGGSFLHWLTR
jgi:CubicO group peptidase (beta-lactamase class C family)